MIAKSNNCMDALYLFVNDVREHLDSEHTEHFYLSSTPSQMIE